MYRKLYVRTLISVVMLLTLLIPGTSSLTAQPAAPQMSQQLDSDSLLFVKETSITNAIARLEAGELDLYTYMTANPAIAQQVAASPSLEAYTNYGSYNELTLNPSGPVFSGTGKLNPFAVPRVREALNWLVDRDYIANAILGGLGTPRWHALNTVSYDYTLAADAAHALELVYGYNKTLAQNVIAAEMMALGATLIGNKWQYAGEPVELIFLIRVEDERRQIGDYVANQLEDIGFTVNRRYVTAGEASPIWMSSNPADGLWHIYTGSWVATVVSRDLGDNFLFFYTNQGLNVPLWQAYVNTPEFFEVAQRLGTHEFATVEEQRALLVQALELALEDSVRIWLFDRALITPRRAAVSYASDLYGSFNSSYLWPYTLSRTGAYSTPLTIATVSFLTEPWNPLGGTNWLYDRPIIGATGDNALLRGPYNGLALAQRIESATVTIQEGYFARQTYDWVTLDFAPTIPVPGDAWADWDAAAQRFLTVSEVYTQPVTALRKSVVTYPVNLTSSVTWHDGSPFSIADILLNIILTFDPAKEASAVYDPAAVSQLNGFKSVFRGVRILSTSPLVIETYMNTVALDAEHCVSTWWPTYTTGPGAWHNLTLGLLAEAAGEAAFGASKANDLGIEWLDYVSEPSLAILNNQLSAAQLTHYIPYSPTLAAYISAPEATARYTNLAQWFSDRGHFWIGTGPYYLREIAADRSTLVLQPYTAFPDPPEKWDDFTTPAIPEVSVSGPESIERGETVTYTVSITLDGQPYPDSDIEAVRYQVLDSANRVWLIGDAVSAPAFGLAHARVTTTTGAWLIILDAEATRRLPPGSSQLIVTAASKHVVIPGYADQPFIGPGAEIYLPLVVR